MPKTKIRWKSLPGLLIKLSEIQLDSLRKESPQVELNKHISPP